MEHFLDYCSKAASGSKPFWGCLLGVLNYILFPDEAFFTAAVAVGGTMILDIITKYVALSAKNGGFCNAFKTRAINSNSFWSGTAIKLYSYLVIAILAGLSYRVVQLEQVSVFFASVVYTILFLREVQSICENLRDAGAPVEWLIFWTKKKQDQILETDDTPKEGGGSDAETI